MRSQANLLVKNALAKVGIERGDNGSIYPRPKGESCVSRINGAPTEAEAEGRGGRARGSTVD